jgi:hypothetical protein
MNVTAVADQHLICPKTSLPLMTGCALKGCEFWTDVAWASNCILVYMKHHKLESLKAEDIAILLQIPLRKVGEILAIALAKLREEMVIPQEEKDERQFNFIPLRTICCVCEKPIVRTPLVSLELPTLQLAYCSKECKQAKPPRAIALESKYGVDFTTLLERASRKFKTITAMEQALGIDRWTIQDLLQKAKAPRECNSPLS